MKRGLVALGWLVMASACTGKVKVDTTDSDDANCGGDEVVVEFTTSDDVTLKADLWPASEPGKGAVVLFHMIPPTYHRGNWLQRVRAAIHDLGVTVLTVDRRGAGESGGVALEAYEGPGALQDMEAALRFLTDSSQACSVDAGRLVLVGASNGTTAVMDYTVAHDPVLAGPAALIWMSPGTYTENQNTIADHRQTLDALPILWLYPTNEPWSQDFVSAAPAGWSFVERGDQHGTKMFDGGDLEQQTLSELTAWIAQAQ